MSSIEGYLSELEAALRVRGRMRRRLLTECRGHLAESSAVVGPTEAVRRFGSAGELARSIDMEAALRRGLRATVASVAAVCAVAASTLWLVNAADAGMSAQIAWAVAFFASAQISAVAVFLAVVRAGAMRYGAADPDEVVLLCRRNTAALAFALLTLLAAAGAVPGHVPAWKLLVGPVVALLAVMLVARSRSLARKLTARSPNVVHRPLADVLVIVGRSSSPPARQASGRSITVLLPTVAVAAVAAYWWDHLDQGTPTSSVIAAGVESALVVAGFLLLGRLLGLRAGGAHQQRRRAA